MIDINELRRLAQEATPGLWKACRNHECYEGAYFEIDPEDEAEYAAKSFTHIEARTGVVAAAHDLFEFDRANAAFIAAANPAVIDELLDRLEATEKDVALKEKVIDALGSELNAVAKERDAMRAENAALVDDMNLLRDNNTALRADKATLQQMTYSLKDRLDAKGQDQAMQDVLMKFDPATGEERPYPSHATQWRNWHGTAAWLFDPWTGKQRNAYDVGSDVYGLLIVPAGTLGTDMGGGCATTTKGQDQARRETK